MNRKVLFDQYSLSELGSDRGLGRYAAMMALAIAELPGVELKPLVHTPLPFRAPELVSIQHAISKLALDRDVPYHSTSVYHLPLIKTRPWLCSIQDVIPLDLEDYRKLGIKSKFMFMNARRSDFILANSAYTKNRIVQRMGISPSRIMTCLLPIAPAYNATPSAQTLTELRFRLRDSGVDLARRFAVALADLRTPDPRKRYHWIDEVAESLADIGVQMVVTGRGISQKDFPHSIVIGSLDDRKLSALYSIAVAMYYPTAYEGQGLPPQEAMASGCPVVAYKNTSVQEVVEADVFLLDDPIPWERQLLREPLPLQGRNEVVAKIGLYVEFPDELIKARHLARQIAHQHSWSSFSHNLADFYNRYFRGVHHESSS